LHKLSSIYPPGINKSETAICVGAAGKWPAVLACQSHGMEKPMIVLSSVFVYSRSDRVEWQDSSISGIEEAIKT
jgi:hypothetical protein